VNPVKKTFEFGGSTVTLETGRIARQATSAVLVTMDDTSVLVTVMADKEPSPMPFFPLAVHYVEKTYSVGKIPGGFLKREGPLSEKETLTSRLIDRPIRPLFADGFKSETQVICTVMSSNRNVDPDIPAMIGASAALSISGLPFEGPIGGARVGFSDEEGYFLNPTYEKLDTSRLNMVVAGTEDAVLMVESEADCLTEDQMLGAVLFAHDQMQTAIKAINEFTQEVQPTSWNWQPEPEKTELKAQVKDQFGSEIEAAYQVKDKLERQDRLGELKTRVVEALASTEEGGEPTQGDVKEYFGKVEKEIVRGRILRNEPRIDGRDNRTVRPIDVEVGLLPNAHGSALFTRGETQAIVSTTLGTARDAKLIDSLRGESKDPFLFHYNFPSYSVGETGRMGPPGRREIGHGRLARRGVQAVMPKHDDFPYTVRCVSEITESNGSSSMASVCGSSLALMDAGVPVKSPVAGIAMGLVKEGDDFAVLTDILGDEDHLGDMDFKVAGTPNAVTALQMDIKIAGITEQIMEMALQQANEARQHILGEMAKVIAEARPEVADNAPTMHTMHIDSQKIRDVIGKGGATIRQLSEDTGAAIDIEDDGTIKIYAANSEQVEKATFRIMELTADVEVGRVYRGRVERIVEFGAFVNLLPGKDGLVHISQIADRRIETVREELTEGQEVLVKVLDVDQRGRVKLSMKEIQGDEEPVDFRLPGE
jgi:polyribonucleotide nucleotidyltransferase